MSSSETIRTIYLSLLRSYPTLFTYTERKQLKLILKAYYENKSNVPSTPGHSVSDRLHVVKIILHEIGLGRAAVLSVLLQKPIENGHISAGLVEKQFGTSIHLITHGLTQVEKLYKHHAAIETENFRKLLLTFAEDVRVILIILAEKLHVMRHLDSYPEDTRLNIARECSFLYAPLAHRMGLYAIKTELEDLSLKHTNRDIYKEIARKLNETKRERDKYIKEFIVPLKENLKSIGFDFEIKGRTKSIYSIYNKIKKQNTDFEKIYDLFAIRIIIDAPLDKEKTACWQAYSIVTDMYQPNPKRLRDWLSIPKSNGYESLHTTVIGPQEKWVEVQIRTIRMDEIAEKGLAAHWKYKGIKGESGMEQWLKSIREILENPELNAVDFMDEFKLNLYDEEVFVFTPNGDLHKLPKGATVLDFAFSIHSELGAKCVGAKINNKNVPIKHVLKNGDQVEVLTSPTQKPNQAWLNIVTTAKARNKIRQSLKEIEYKDAEIGREILLRRFKNWKIEFDDGNISRTAKKRGYKKANDLYQDIAHEKVDIHEIRDIYLEFAKKDNCKTETEVISAEGFSTEIQPIDIKEDILVIGQDLKNIDFKFAKCCNPVYGDKVFGFVSVGGGIKVHRQDCPNAPQMTSRFGYRIIQARWSGKSEGYHFSVTLRIIGQDDIGIVTNITSLISKEKNILLRSISIDSSAGLFQGNITLLVNDTKDLKTIIKKITEIKGIKEVIRI